MENEILAGLLDSAGSDYKRSSYAGAAGAFAQLASAEMNYMALRTNASALKVQANNIELQAQQKANMLREQFISSVGAYQMSAANRGVSVGSGSVISNIEGSSASLGKDIQKIKKSSQLQANALRTQARVARWQGRSQLVSGILGSVAMGASAAENYFKGSELQAQAAQIKSGGGNNG